MADVYSSSGRPDDPSTLDRSSLDPMDTITHIWHSLGLPPDVLASLNLGEETPQIYPSSFKIDHLAQSTIALSALSAALVHSLRTSTSMRGVTVPKKAACLAFKTERLYILDGKRPASVWGPIGGLHQARGRYVRIHDSFPNHRHGTLKLLRLEKDATREDVARTVRKWGHLQLESAAAQRGLAIYALRGYEEWDATPQAATISNYPVRLRKITEDGPLGFPPQMQSPADRCLRGLRVIELSRVIAAPVAGMTLAAHGADVLWVTSPNLPDLPALDRNLSRGKRSIQLDLTTKDCETLRDLVRGADVFLQSYRPGSLAGKGFSPEELVKLRPGIICANLSALGPEGPWSERRGFDSLVQTCSGMNVSEAEHYGEGEAAKPTPCQALDHAAGYLLATGVAAAVYKRAREGGSWEVNVSLAGVGKFLRSLGQWEGREGFDRAEGLPQMHEVEEEVLEERESDFGRLRALKHAASVDGAMPGWDRMPKRLGSDEAKWL